MLRTVITVSSLDNTHAARCCLLSTSLRESTGFVQTLAQLRWNFKELSEFPIWGYLLLLPYFIHEFPLASPADDMWANAGLYSCSGLRLPFISHLCCGNKIRSPVGIFSLLGTSVHLLLSATQPLLRLGASLHFHRSAWCQRRMAAEHRRGQSRNAHMSPWPVSLARCHASH